MPSMLPNHSATSISGGQLRSCGISQKAGHKPFPAGKRVQISQYP